MDVASITYHSISPRMLTLLGEVHEQLGEVNARHLHLPPPGSEKAYRISTVHATLAIEGGVLDHRPIGELADDHGGSTRGPEALEAVNTHRLQAALPDLDPFVDQDLRQAHSILMHGLAVDAGQYRNGPMEVFYGEPQPLRTASAHAIPVAVQELLTHAEEDDFPALITSCVLHFGLIYLRPFTAGNGRLARSWQRLFLMRRWPVFHYLPIEAFIHKAEPAYHASLEYADRRGDCGGFIIYLLERINEALAELLATTDRVLSGVERVQRFLIEDRSRTFRRKDYLKCFPELSTATATRDLKDAVEHGTIRMTGKGRSANYTVIG